MTAVTRSIQGIINADGTIRSGTGFTVTHNYTGVYIIKFDDPFDSTTFSGFSVKVRPSLDESEPTKTLIRPMSLPRGDNAWVISGNEEGMKYFTFEVNPNELVMKDLAVEFFAYGLDEEEEEEESTGSAETGVGDLLPTFRTITGTIDAAGNRLTGEGFTVAPHTHVGSYLVKFDDPFDIVQEGGFTVQVIGEEAVGENGTTDVRFIPSGDNAVVVEETKTQMKYFTFEVRNDGLYMKNLAVEFSAQGMDF